MPTLKAAGLAERFVVSSIVWIQADGNYVRLYFANGPFYLAAQTLSWYEGRLT